MEQAKNLAAQFMGDQPQAQAGGVEPSEKVHGGVGEMLMDQVRERFEGGEPHGEAAAAPPAGGDAGGSLMGQAQRMMKAYQGGGEERPAGETGAGGSGEGFMGQAQRMMKAYQGEERPAGETGAAGGGEGFMGQAQRMMKAYQGGPEEPAPGGGGGGVMGQAQQAMAANPGIVDQALKMFQQTQGRPFTGKEPGELDQLHSLASGMLGSPIGREVLMAGVRQRLGM